MQSILGTIKKMLGIADEYEVYDTDILVLLNSVFISLKQLGVGPKEGYSVKDANNLWTEFLPDGPLLEATKSYIYMKVRLIFDPPSTSYIIESFNKAIAEYEFRANVDADTYGKQAVHALASWDIIGGR